ncbi:MAG TPA: hypothetical protein VN685_05505 [Rhizomicrobium sp.]|nr:hypothetical protein [Rhizomicrobium sp.]
MRNANVLAALAEMSVCGNLPSLVSSSQRSGAPMPKQDEGADIQYIARELIDRYADEAELIAAGHADTVLDLGDAEAFEVWRTVMAAIHAIQEKNRCSS